MDSKVKMKFTLYEAMEARGGGEVQLYSFFDLGARKGGGVCRFATGKMTRYPSYRRLGGPQDRSGGVRKNSPHHNLMPGPSSPHRVAMPTELSRPIGMNGLL